MDSKAPSTPSRKKQEGMESRRETMTTEEWKWLTMFTQTQQRWRRGMTAHCGVTINDTLMDFTMSTSAYQIYIKMHLTVEGHVYKINGLCKGFSRVTETKPNCHLIWWLWKLIHAQTRVHYQFTSPKLSTRAYEIRETKINASGRWGK